MQIKQLYDIDKNPTEFLNEFSKDLHKSDIFKVFDKYSEDLPEYEVLGFITCELNVHLARRLIKQRCSLRKDHNESSNTE